MKVKDLQKHLEACPPNAEIRMFSDAEGNSIHGYDGFEVQGKIVFLYPDDNYYDDEEIT